MDWIGYADDIALFFTTKSVLQRAMDELSKTFKRFGFSINISKTKTMILNQQHFGTEYPSTICKLDGKDLENVKVFRYLGSQIRFDESTTGNEEIELRIDSAETKFYEIGKKIMNFKIALNTRVKILNSLVRSRLTYSCQAWTLTERQKQRICSTYHSMLRKLVKGGYRRKKDTWSFVHTNEDLVAMCKTDDISVYIERQQRNYLAHVIRMENSNTTKRLLFNENPSQIPGRSITLLSSVTKNQKISENVLFRNSLARVY